MTEAGESGPGCLVTLAVVVGVFTVIAFWVVALLANTGPWADACRARGGSVVGDIVQACVRSDAIIPLPDSVWNKRKSTK